MGRLSAKQKEEAPQYTELADRWMKYIGTIYEDIRKVMLKYAHQQDVTVDDDLINDTIVACYDSVARNGLKIETEDNFRAFLLGAWKRNIYRQLPYDSRKDDNADVVTLHEKRMNEQQPIYDKVKQQLFDDYSTIYIMDIVESHFDQVTFHCFRLKHLLPGCTHARLREITKVKDCRKRVLEVQRWLKANLSRQKIYDAFITDFPDFAD